MPVKGRKNQVLICLFLILGLVAVDQYSKALVYLRLTVGESIPLIKNILHITFVKNTGAAFGLFKNSTVIFIAVSIAAIFFISALIIKSIKKNKRLSNPVYHLSLAIIASGALGNLIDRLRFGYVVDFIDVRIWPVFNIADSAITIGTTLLILFFLLQRQKQ